LPTRSAHQPGGAAAAVEWHLTITAAASIVELWGGDGAASAMAQCCALAFLNLGLPETIVVAVVALLLFGPRAGRTMGSLARTVLGFKKDVDDAKHGIRRQIEREVDDVLRAADPAEDEPSRPKPH
jgi:Sec-independent protein translocase protein TatA